MPMIFPEGRAKSAERDLAIFRLKFRKNRIFDISTNENRCIASSNFRLNVNIWVKRIRVSIRLLWQLFDHYETSGQPDVGTFGSF